MNVSHLVCYKAITKPQVNVSVVQVKGAATMVLETGKHTGQLKDEVCSSSTPTIAALHTLERHAFSSLNDLN
ncbi:Pyrroline-5-carboxylate reductase 1, mitochondrial [Portunus trituberculatus]|uniref:Pyrroline-5-carboxylate reductase 1, mitochondrial n=1 Tax=Portunus trituberculatus TaxID=210409 RepID=A0A5B7J9W7_PORTR|nr:Pyrroline-5-carboxylate reductase 1, mitochondrial [Portunus trituberculatus]